MTVSVSASCGPSVARDELDGNTEPEHYFDSSLGHRHWSAGPVHGLSYMQGQVTPARAPD